jgi:hypothetical protein
MDASANNQKNDQGKRGERFSTKAEVAAGPARVLANNKTNPPSSSLKKKQTKVADAIFIPGISYCYIVWNFYKSQSAG